MLSKASTVSGDSFIGSERTVTVLRRNSKSGKKNKGSIPKVTIACFGGRASLSWLKDIIFELISDLIWLVNGSYFKVTDCGIDYR